MRRRRIDTGLLGEPAHSYYRERRMIRREFRASLMSDTKWRKLFLAIEELELALPLCRIKWIDVQVPRLLRTPTSGTLSLPKPFVDTIEFGSFALCSIEWVEFPRAAKRESNGRSAGAACVQDVDRAERALEGVARFPMENTPEGLRIVGHVR